MSTRIHGEWRVATRPTPTESARAGRFVRVMIGLSLFAHALFHSLPGMLSTYAFNPAWSIWFWTGVWTVASVSLAAAALGLWGWRFFALRWRTLAMVGSMASIVLLMSISTWWTWVATAIDLLVILYAGVSEYDAPDEPAKARHPVAAVLVRTIAGALLVYGGLAIVSRPWQQNWGATEADMRMVLPGDEAAPSRTHNLNHVVTVNAPPERIWPYIVQMGQDKAGFYSYDWLERAVGDDIRNIKRIVPELQTLREGDVVRLTQRDYFFGLMKDGVALKVLKLEPNRLLQMDGWGTFWIEPLPGGKSRFGVRTAIGEMPFLAAPIQVFVFEPMHFIMQQKMLRTIRDLAEQ